MWRLLCCCVTLVITNSLWVQALPTNITFNKINTNHVGIKLPECPENEFFNHEGKACELTCEFPISQDLCNEEKVAACECNKGYVRDETDVCVTFSQCYIPYNIEYNASKPTSYELLIKELTPTLDETQSTNQINDSSVITYDIDEYEDSREIPSLYHSLPDHLVELVVNFVFDRQLQEECLMVFHKIYAQKYDAEDSVSLKYDQQYINELLQKKVREELDSYRNPDYYTE